MSSLAYNPIISQKIRQNLIGELIEKVNVLLREMVRMRSFASEVILSGDALKLNRVSFWFAYLSKVEKFLLTILYAEPAFQTWLTTSKSSWAHSFCIFARSCRLLYSSQCQQSIQTANSNMMHRPIALDSSDSVLFESTIDATNWNIIIIMMMIMVIVELNE